MRRDDPLVSRDDPFMQRDDPSASRDDPFESRDDPSASWDDPCIPVPESGEVELKNLILGKLMWSLHFPSFLAHQFGKWN